MVYALIPQMKVNDREIIGLEPSERDFAELVEVEDPTPDGGLYMTYGRALVSGRRVKLDHIPKQMKEHGGGVLADYTSSYSLLCVSDKFKAVVEAIEPGVHQFIPFEIVGTRKRHVADRWFMVVCNRLDTVDREHTTMVLKNSVVWRQASEVPSEQWPPHIDSNTPGELFLSLSQIGNHHLWYDKHLGDDHPLASDVLVEALKTSGVTGVSFSERRAV
jgi:hypothetical protein